MPDSHFLKEGVIPRRYQSAIAESALSRGNTLVVLPTGLGKTLIAFIAMGEMAKKGRVVFLAPTRPLVAQHRRTFHELTLAPESDSVLITGEISPKKREEAWKSKYCFSTPQSLKNDLLSHRTTADFALVVVDEAHRSVGNYAYTFVAEKCAEGGALMLGLTASPGGSKKRIEEIVQALLIKNIEIRTAEDADVSPYVKKLDITYERVQLGKSFSEARALLSEMLADSAESLSKFGLHVPLRSKRALVELRMKIMKLGDKSRYTALSYYSSVFNLSHMLELIETQGPSPFFSYVEKMKARPETKARHRVFSDDRFMRAVALCNAATTHPKLEKLVEILNRKKGEKFLVFAQYRDSVQSIVDALKSRGFSAERFIGKKDGVKAEEQRKTIERFSKGEFDVMVATSIGEEGLDIPSVDTVVFFEPIPSEIRSIQRRGRAGRLKAGSVVVIMAEGTRDEGHYYSSKKKEENMSKIVHRMKRTFSSQAQGEVAKRPLVPEKADDGGKPQPETDPELGPHKSKQRKITEF